MFLNVRKFILAYHSRGDVNNIEGDMAQDAISIFLYLLRPFCVIYVVDLIEISMDYWGKYVFFSVCL